MIKAKEWNIPDLFDRIKAVATDFASKASPDKLHSTVRELLDVNTSKERVMFMLGANSNSANTVSHGGSLFDHPGPIKR